MTHYPFKILLIVKVVCIAMDYIFVLIYISADCRQYDSILINLKIVALVEGIRISV